MNNLFDKNKKVILLGTFPPPLGGVSVYLERLFFLLKENNYNVYQWDISLGRAAFLENFLSYFKKCFLKNNYIFNINSLSTKIILSILLIQLFSKIEIHITIHNSWSIQSSSSFRIFLLKIFLRKASKLIAVNNDIILLLKEKNIKILPETIVKNAYIVPNVLKEQSIIKTYSSDTISFLDSRKPLLIANGYKLVFHNNVDLYGLDLCVKLTHLLKKDFKNIGFIFALANAEEYKTYLDKIKCEIEELDLNENFHFIVDQKEIWPLFKKTNLMIRPTYSDGYGYSIDEALHFGCPAIASNVCKRAEGTILFENRNLDDLYEKSLKILKLNS